MAIYHLSIKIGSRSKGQSAISASAYRSGTRLKDEETGRTVYYKRRSRVVYSEVMLCKNAPSEYSDRQILWNAVHKVEKSKNSQLWREIVVALPIEFDRDTQIEVVRKFVGQLTEEGMCGDWSLHDNNDGNPHAHIMLTTRAIKENGEWAEKEETRYVLDENGDRIPIIDPSTGKQKIGAKGRRIWKRETVKPNVWNSRENAEKWRESWARCCNERLSSENQIDHRSYERQGKNQIPTIHEGYAARKRAAKGLDTDIININREIRQLNEAIKQNEQAAVLLEQQRCELEKQLAEERQESEKNQKS